MDVTDETQAPAEYPKMLYKDGQPYGENGRGVPHQDTVTVSNAEEEAEAIADGFATYTPPGPEEEPVVEAAPDEGAQTEGGEDTAVGIQAGESTEPSTSGADSVAGDGSDSVAG